MGILNRIFGRPESTQRDGGRGQSKVRVEVTISRPGEASLVKLLGTTTIAKEAVAALAGRHGAGEGGYFELEGTLQREPDNQADPHAVAVHVEGERVGYLSGYVARDLDLSNGGARSVSVQIFTEMLPKGLRAEAWAWLGQGPPHWQWSQENRPPMSSRAKAEAHHDSVSEMVSTALADGGDRAEQFKSGMVNGIHYLQLVEPIKQLKRDDRLDEALSLCYAAIRGAEGSAAREGLEPAPWYTEQAAIIHRKLGQHDQEVAVLVRWVDACPPGRGDGSRIKQRLDKLRP
ncbi:MAG: hypothetical protein L0G99_04870 [Propionibacteriales bacterium]|nr:hypothetical protein [Propionibacteriales bacterium]